MYPSLAARLGVTLRRSVRGLRILSRYYVRTAHRTEAVNPHPEQMFFLRLVLAPQRRVVSDHLCCASAR